MDNKLIRLGEKMDLIKKLFIAIAIILFNFCISFAQEASVNEIMDNVHKVYREAKSYSDTGEVKTTLMTEGKQETYTVPFTTAFVRPDRFRFEFKYKSNASGPDWRRYVVWQNGNKIVSWRSKTNESENLQSLSIAIASATGISGGSASDIPRLLLPYKVGGGTITDLQEMKIVESKDGIIEISGLMSESSSVNLWINSENFLIKKIDIHTKSNDFETTTSITYEPSININIDDKNLELETDGHINNK